MNFKSVYFRVIRGEFLYIFFYHGLHGDHGCSHGLCGKIDTDHKGAQSRVLGITKDSKYLLAYVIMNFNEANHL